MLWQFTDMSKGYSNLKSRKNEYGKVEMDHKLCILFIPSFLDKYFLQLQVWRNVHRKKKF